MKFKKSLLLIFIILLSSILVSSEEYDFDNSIMVSNLEISSSLNIIPESSDYRLSELTATLKLKPNENYQQNILSSAMPPNNKETADSIIFTWENVKDKKLEFYLRSKIKTKNFIKTVKKKIHYPLDDNQIQKEVLPYLNPTETIKSNHILITKKASEIVEGEDDQFIITVKLADWIKSNIEYDLNTLTAESTKDAVWVLENKEGVCDEITILFLSMLRSLGIPAKYSYGLAYSNLEQYEDFVSHAWSEVYFPDYGWIPFDVTYGQFGYIDSSHIKLGESVDTNKSSVSYSWRGYDVSMESESLNIGADIEEIIDNPLNLVDIKASVEKQNTGPTSYNLVKVDVKNNKDHYVVTELLLSRPKELKSYADKKIVYLKPNEQKTVGFIVKNPDIIEQDVSYKYPIIVRTSGNINSETYFESTVNDPVFSKSEIDEIIKGLEEEKDKKYSREIDLNCNIDKTQFYPEDTARIDCAIKNKGNTLLKSLNLCLDDDCEEFDLPINQEHKQEFSFNDNAEPGNKELTISLRNDDVFKKQDIKYVLLDKPLLEIKNMEYPEKVNLDEEFIIKVSVEKKSFASPKNVKISLDGKYLHRETEISTATTDINMNFKQVLAKELSPGANLIKVNVYYEDDEANAFTDQDEITITLENIGFWDKVKLFFVHLLRIY